MSNNAETYKRDGYIVLRNFFTPLESNAIVESADNLFKLPDVKGRYMKYYENTSKGRILARIEKFFSEEARIMNLLKTKIMPELISLEETPMTLFKDKLNWKLPGGGEFKPHQDFEAYSDFPPTYYTTCALFADECTIENGCLEMVAGEANKGVLPNNNGCITPELVSSYNWEPVLVGPSDLVIFNSFVPHRSGKNTSNNTRRVFYFTFNKLSEGNYYGAYFDKKRKEMPPDFERDPNKTYNTQNKYNLANPIN